MIQWLGSGSKDQVFDSAGSIVVQKEPCAKKTETEGIAR
jgi:hypothetical protein